MQRQKKIIVLIIVSTSRTHEVMRIPAHFGMLSGVGSSTQFVKGPHDILPIVPQQQSLLLTQHQLQFYQKQCEQGIENPHPTIGQSIENSIESEMSTRNAQNVIFRSRFLSMRLRKESNDCIISDCYAYIIWQCSIISFQIQLSTLYFNQIEKLIDFLEKMIFQTEMTKYIIIIVISYMFKIALALLLLAIVTGIKIENNLDIGELKELHGWLILGGTYLSKGKVQLSIKIELSSNLYEERGYLLEVLILSQNELETQKKEHCSKYASSSNEVQIRLIKNRNEAAYISERIIEIEQKTDQFAFLLLRDCQHSLVRQYFEKEAHFKFQITILNNQSFLSQQEQYHQWITYLTIILYTYLILYVKKTVKNQGNTNVLNNYLFIYFVLAIAVSICKAIMSSSDSLVGGHHILLDTLAIVIDSLRSILFLYVSCNISFGWTIQTDKQSVLTDYSQRITILIIQIVLQTLSQLYTNNIMFYDWTKNIEGAVNILTAFILMMLLSVKMKASIAKAKKFYALMMLVVLLNMISTPIFCVLLQRQTYYMHKASIESATTLLALANAFIILKTFLGPSSLHYKICLTNKSFMD